EERRIEKQDGFLAGGAGYPDFDIGHGSVAVKTVVFDFQSPGFVLDRGGAQRAAGKKSETGQDDNRPEDPPTDAFHTPFEALERHIFAKRVRTVDPDTFGEAVILFVHIMQSGSKLAVLDSKN